MMIPTTIRPVGPLDIPAMSALIHREGIKWEQTSEDLSLLVCNDENIVLGAFHGNNEELLGTAALSLHGSHGWVSYVATHPRFRGHGIATSLVSSLLAGPLGRGIYEKLGFESVEGLSAHLLQTESERKTDPCPLHGRSILPARDALPAIAALDREVYGSDRTVALRSWLDSAPDACWALFCNDDRRLRGFVMGRPIYPSGVFLGPVIA